MVWHQQRLFELCRVWNATIQAINPAACYLPNAGGEVSTISFLRVENVRADSVAARAGVTEGLEVVAIQGKRVRGLTESEVDDLMKLPVIDELVLTVRNDAKTERPLRIAARRPAAAASVAPAAK